MPQEMTMTVQFRLTIVAKSVKKASNDSERLVEQLSTLSLASGIMTLPLEIRQKILLLVLLPSTTTDQTSRNDLGAMSPSQMAIAICSTCTRLTIEMPWVLRQYTDFLVRGREAIEARRIQIRSTSREGSAVMRQFKVTHGNRIFTSSEEAWSKFMSTMEVLRQCAVNYPLVEHELSYLSNQTASFEHIGKWTARLNSIIDDRQYPAVGEAAYLQDREDVASVLRERHGRSYQAERWPPGMSETLRSRLANMYFSCTPPTLGKRLIELDDAEVPITKSRMITRS